MGWETSPELPAEGKQMDDDGQPIGAALDAVMTDEDVGELESPFNDAPIALFDLLDAADERVRACVASALEHGGLDQEANIATSDDHHANLRRLVCGRVEEYRRHTGPANMIREAIDGRVGGDPLAGLCLINQTRGACP